jgi:uncharacterized phage-associated protein
MSSICLNPSGDNNKDNSKSKSENKSSRTFPNFHVFAVANWFLDTAAKDKRELNLMRLQRFVYLAYGWYYAYKDSILFGEEMVMSTNGPIVPLLERMFSRFDSKPITRRAQIFQDAEKEVLDFTLDPTDKEKFDRLPLVDRQRLVEMHRDVEECLRAVYVKYRDVSARGLMEAVCGVGSDVCEIYDNIDTYAQYAPLPKKVIQKYFKDYYKIT